jgi:septal ring factor EnvC (AmiA/AmiB activator)
MDPMPRARYILASLLVAFAIALGCSKPSVSPSTTADKSTDTKVAKLEADLKKANDELARLSAQVRLDEAKIKDLEKQREEYKNTLKERTAERDTAAAKMDSFRKNVKELLGQMDAALAEPFKPMPEAVSVLPTPSIPTINTP